MVSPIRRLGRTGLFEPSRGHHVPADPPEPVNTKPPSPRRKHKRHAIHSNQYKSAVESKERYNPFNIVARHKRNTTAAPSTPIGMNIVSPISTDITNSPRSPTRRNLIDRRTPPSCLISEVTEEPYSELRDQAEIEDLREKNTRTESQLRVLHERFHHIQEGLGTIDQERATLVGKAEKLEQEKKAIQRQLELRDKEILSLVKRCASQEERMKETSQLRAKNKELSTRLESAKKKSRKFHEEEESISSLRRQLQESELTREELQDRLAKVQREHDTIADTLQECLANISRLTEEKREIEEQRRREKKRSQLELEKQRLEHIQVANCLKDDIENKRIKIEQMEHILQDNMISNTSLRREKAILSGDQEKEVQEVVDKYETELAALKQQIKDTEIEKDQECEAKLEQLRLEIQDMEAMMRELESEFSRQMQDLMVKQRSLDETEEHNKSLEDQIETMEKVGHEHSALLDIVGIMDSNLADLTNENAQLTLDKELLLGEVEEMKEKTREVQTQLNRMKDQRKAREDDFRDLLRTESEESTEELTSALEAAKVEVESLKAELESRNRWITKLEEEINESRKSVIEKEDKIREICYEHEQSKALLKSSLEEAHTEIRNLSRELSDRERSLASTEGKLDAVRNVQDNDKKRIDRLEDDYQNLQRHRNNLSGLGREDDLDCTSERRDPVDESDDSVVEIIKQRLERNVTAAKETERALREEISSLRKLRESLQQQMVSKNMTISKRDHTINDLKAAQIQNEARCKELEENLRNVTSELEQYQTEVQILQKTNSAPEIEAEYCSKSIDERAEDSFCEDVERLGTEMEDVSSRCLKLEKEIAAGNKLLSEREKRIQELEREHKVISLSKASTESALKDANKKIRDLQSQLEKKNEIFLETSLREAQKELCKQKMKTVSVEKQYSESMQWKRESYNREACTRIASLEDQLSECRSKISDLEQALESSKRVLEEKEEHIEELEQRIKEDDIKFSILEETIEKKDQSNDDLQNLLNDQEKQCSAHQNVIEDYRQKNKDLKNRKESMKEVWESMKAERDRLKEELLQSRAEVSELQASQEPLVTKLHAEKNIAEERAESLNCQLKEAHQELDSMNLRLQEADTKIAEKSLQYSQLESLNKEIEAQIQILRIELEEKNEQVSSLDKKLMTFEILAKQEKQWQEEKPELLQELSTQDDTMKRLQFDLATKTEQFEIVEKSTEELRQANESLEAREKDLTSKCKSLEENVKSSNQQIETQNKSWGEKLEESQTLRDQAESNVSRLQNEQELLKSRLNDASQEIALLDEELSKKNQKVDILEHEIEKLSKSEVEEAYVESEKKRLSAENVLCDAREEIKILKAKLDQTETRLMNVDAELETAKSTIKEKDDLLEQAQQKHSDLEAKNNELDELVESRESRLLKVEEELHVTKREIVHKEDEACSLESLKAALQMSLDKAHVDLSYMTDYSESQNQKMDALEEELQTARQALEEKDTKFESLDKALEYERDSIRKFREENSSLLKEVSDKTLVIEANVKDLVSLQEALGYERDSKIEIKEENFKLQTDLSDKKRVIDDNTEQIAEQQNLIASLQNDLQQKSKAFDTEHKTRQNLEREYAAEKESRCKQVEDFEASISKMKTTIALKDDEIRELRLVELKDAEQAIQSLTVENVCLKNQVQDFEIRTKKMETEIVLKADEIRELRLVELKDAEQAIESLTSENRSMKEKIEGQKLLNDELESDRNSWMLKADEATEMADLANEEYDKTIQLYKSQTQQLKESNEHLNTEVAKQDERLKERHATIMSLTQTKDSLQDEQRQLQSKFETLQKSETKARNDVENLKAALDLGIRREREDSSRRLKQATASHRKELATAQESLRERSEKLVETQKAFEERGALLRDMVDHNKDYESKLEKKQAELEAVKAESEKNFETLEANKKELLAVRTKIRDTERFLNAKYNEELDRRESAEKSLANMKVHVNEATQTKKLLADTEKENELLKDKISRQEAYMQRKLQKEKQDRLASCSPKKAGAPSPNRVGAPSPKKVGVLPSPKSKPPMPPSPSKRTVPQSQLRTPPRRTPGNV